MGDYLAEVIEQVRAEDAARERSLQAAVGWSEVAGCRAAMGFRIAGEWASDDADNWRAVVGTWNHERLTVVRQTALWPGDADFNVGVEYGGIPGHADEVDYAAGEVTDYKFPTLASLAVWDDPEVLADKMVQPMGYAAGVMLTERWQKSAPEHRRDRPRVRLLACPVDGTFDDWRVFEMEFDPAIADAAVTRYHDVAAKQAAGEFLPRDKPEWWCERYCEFFTRCRGSYEPPELPEITDPESAAALEAYGKAKQAESEAGKAIRTLRPIVEPLRGQARGYKAYRGRPGSKTAKDMAQIERDYAATGLPVPEIKIPTDGNLYVKPIKTEAT